jgi:alcohol dehydrogenase
MNALVYHGPGKKSWGDVAKPEIRADTDAIVRVDTVTICDTDLHILKGDVPEVTDGRILGHEAVGTVEAVGAGVKHVTPGDRVLVSCITACGTCRFCREAQYGQCLGGGGWVLGHLIDGTQAEYVRVPFVDTSTHPVPDGVSDEAMLMLADILPTGYECGVLNGRVQPGDVVAVVGAGPIGLSAIMSSRLYSPSHVVAIDLADSRLEAAKQFGADVVVNNGREDPRTAIDDLTNALGADVAIEAVCSGDVRARGSAHPPRRPSREHRRPRRAGDIASRGPLDPRRNDHHRAGRHLLDADTRAAAPGTPDRRRSLRDPPLPARRIPGRVRRLRPRRRDGRAQSRVGARSMKPE